MTDVKKTILARRARFIAAAIAGAGLAAGCSSSDPQPQACLSIAHQPDAKADGDKDGSDDAVGEATACLSIALEAGPDAAVEATVCLSVALEAGPDAAVEATVCLSVALEAGLDSDADAGPQMCLQPPPDDAGAD